MTMFVHYAGRMAFWTAVTFLLLLLFGRKRIHEKKNIFQFLLIAYIVGICSQTLFPIIRYGIDSETSKPYLHMHYLDRSLAGLNLIPFQTILSEITGNIPELGAGDRLVAGIMNLVGNICLYLPVGFLLPLAWKRCGKLGTVLAVAAALSCVIEILQFFIGRTADIDDVLLHLLGAAAGYGVWIGAGKLTSGAKRSLSVGNHCL